MVRSALWRPAVQASAYRVAAVSLDRELEVAATTGFSRPSGSGARIYDSHLLRSGQPAQAHGMTCR